MTETAAQLLSHAIPVCNWLQQQNSNQTLINSHHPQFPDNVREWIGFFQNVRLAGTHFPPPAGQFPIFPTIAQSLRVEGDAKTWFHFNVLAPVGIVLPQGQFCGPPHNFVGSSDYVLCINNYTVAKMPIEMKTRHNLDLRGYNFWQIYRYADRRHLTERDQDFKFKKRILSQVFGEMACNGLH